MVDELEVVHFLVTVIDLGDEFPKVVLRVLHHYLGTSLGELYEVAAVVFEHSLSKY